MAEGHRYPHHYPLSTLWMETELARERVNLRIATESSLMRTVIASVLSTDNSGVENLKTELRKLTHG